MDAMEYIDAWYVLHVTGCPLCGTLMEHDGNGILFCPQCGCEREVYLDEDAGKLAISDPQGEAGNEGVY